MYSFENLLSLYKITLNSDKYNKDYIENLTININKEYNNFLLNFIIINSIHDKIEENIKKIYIICPILLSYSFVYGLKQFIYMF